MELLRLVASTPGIGVSAAAKGLYLAGNSVSTLVKQLTAAGLLRREPGRDDRRSARLPLTLQGEARLRDWRERRAALVRTPGRAGANAGPCWCARTSPGLGEADRQALAAAVPALRGLADSLREEAAP